jgi:chromosome segregation ATPase
MTCQSIHAGGIDDLARRLDRLRAQAERRPDDYRAQLAHAEARADYEAARAADLQRRNAVLQRRLRLVMDELSRKARQVEAFGAINRQSSRFKSGTPDASTGAKRRGRRGVAALADLFTMSGDIPAEEGRAA